MPPRPPIRRVTTDALDCCCQRCGHVWLVVGEVPPKRCASCKAPGWQRARAFQRLDLRKPSPPAKRRKT